MTSGPDLTQRVIRLENETESIYEILTEVQATQRDHSRILARHTRRLDSIDTTLTEHTRRLDSIDTTLEKHTGRFDRIDGTLEEILRRLPEPS